MTTFNDKVYEMGGVALGAGLLGLAGGNEYFLDPTGGNDNNLGTSPGAGFKTLPVAYAAMTDNNNDILYYIPGTSSISLSAEFTWAKSYTHFIGISGPNPVGNRARIFQTAGTAALSPLITISGSGCVWANLYIFQGVDDADSLVDVYVSGSRNYFENVHFAGGGHTTNAVDGAASLSIAGHENLFRHCQIGVDTVAAATGVVNLNVVDAVVANVGAARNKFEDCAFVIWPSSASAAHVELLAIDSVDRYLWFDHCMFINQGTACAAAFVLTGSPDSTNRAVLLTDCRRFGALLWVTGTPNFIFCEMPVGVGDDHSGFMLAAET
jgi:hypothetical protein